MPNKGKYGSETRAKAVRLVRDHAGDYPAERAAITAVPGRLGMSSETLRKWIGQGEVDDGSSPGVSSTESAETGELRHKNRELEQAIKILKAATSFFGRQRDSRAGYSGSSSRLHRGATEPLAGPSITALA